MTAIDTDETRSARKHRAILEAATAAFLDRGYSATTMDEVAARAKVSKQTVYKHCADKASLFTEIVVSTVDAVAGPVHEQVAELELEGEIEIVLRDLARRQLASVMQPTLLRLRRLVIAEAGRFPELGRIFFERGPQPTIEALAAALVRLAERGALVLDDPAVAAAQLNWLVMAAPLNRAMLLGEDEPPGRRQLHRHADAAVAMFLAAYGAPSSSDA